MKNAERSKDVILLVDDDRNFMEQAKTMLRPASKRGLLSATTAHGALRLIRQLGPEAVSLALVDLNLPGMNGFDLIKKLRSTYAQIPVVAMSGVYDGVALEIARYFGAADTLSKPISENWLATLNRLQKPEENVNQ